MKRFYGKLLAFTSVLILLVGLTGCAGTRGAGQEAEKDGKIHLSVAWWGSQERNDKTMDAIKLFEKKNPNIKITAQFTGWDGYWQKMSTAAAGKNLPDIIQMDYSYLNEYVSRGLIANLNSYVKSGVLDLSDADDAYVKSGYVDNKLYAVNLGANAVGIAYDPAMLKKAGISDSALKPGYTWDDYAKLSRQLKEKLGSGVYGVGGVKNDIGSLNVYLRQHGLKLYKEDGSALGYDDDQVVVDFFNYWKKLLDDGIAAPPKVTGDISDLGQQLIVKKKSPVLWFTTNQLIALQQLSGRPLKLAVTPSTPGGKEGLYVKPSMFFSVSSNSKQKKAAAKFIDFITNDLDANDILAAERGVPISSKVREHLKPSLDDAAKETFDYLDVVVKHSSQIYPPEPVGASEVGDLYGRITQQLNYGKMAPEEAAKKFHQEANSILAQKK